jgi:hypothetical protein
MEAQHATTALLLTTLMLATPMASAASPNVDDGTDDKDPRTLGTTPLPDSLDLDQADIQPKDQTIDFTFTVEDLTIPATGTLWTFTGDEVEYEFRFDVDPTIFDGTECEGATTGVVEAKTLVPAVFDPLMKSWIRCLDDSGQEVDFVAATDQVSVDREANTITVTVERSTSPMFDHDTILEEPEILVYRERGNVNGIQSVVGLDDPFDTAGPGQGETI